MQKSHFYLKISDSRITVKMENKIMGQYHDTFIQIILLVHLQRGKGTHANTAYSDIFSKQRYKKGTQSLRSSVILTPRNTFLLEKLPFLSY